MKILLNCVFLLVAHVAIGAHPVEDFHHEKDAHNNFWDAKLLCRTVGKLYQDIHNDLYKAENLLRPIALDPTLGIDLRYRAYRRLAKIFRARDVPSLAIEYAHAAHNLVDKIGEHMELHASALAWLINYPSVSDTLAEQHSATAENLLAYAHGRTSDRVRAKLYIGLGYFYLRVGHRDTATRNFESAIKLVSDVPGASLLITRAKLGHGLVGNLVNLQAAIKLARAYAYHEELAEGLFALAKRSDNAELIFAEASEWARHVGNIALAINANQHALSATQNQAFHDELRQKAAHSLSLAQEDPVYAVSHLLAALKIARALRDHILEIEVRLQLVKYSLADPVHHYRSLENLVIDSGDHRLHALIKIGLAHHRQKAFSNLNVAVAIALAQNDHDLLTRAEIGLASFRYRNNTKEELVHQERAIELARSLPNKCLLVKALLVKARMEKFRPLDVNREALHYAIECGDKVQEARARLNLAVLGENQQEHLQSALECVKDFGPTDEVLIVLREVYRLRASLNLKQSDFEKFLSLSQQLRSANFMAEAHVTLGNAHIGNRVKHYFHARAYSSEVHDDVRQGDALLGIAACGVEVEKNINKVFTVAETLRRNSRSHHADLLQSRAFLILSDVNHGHLNKKTLLTKSVYAARNAQNHVAQIRAIIGFMSLNISNDEMQKHYHVATTICERVVAIGMRHQLMAEIVLKRGEFFFRTHHYNDAMTNFTHVMELVGDDFYLSKRARAFRDKIPSTN